MKNRKNKLLLQQLDAKLRGLTPLRKINLPSGGWISTIRKALGMSLRQLGDKMEITPPSVLEMETREQNGSISLKTLREFAKAMDMKLVYGFVPNKKSIEAMINERALEIATEIVLRTSASMKLEDQENSKKRIQKAIKERAEQIKNELPKMLWD